MECRREEPPAPVPPVFDPPGGVYVGEEVVIAMFGTGPDEEIRYTADGSEPASGSALYNGPEFGTTGIPDEALFQD